jgi:hypothetical protein
MNLIRTVLGVTAAIIFTGVLLEEAGKGTLGSAVKTIALKATRGYGQGA